LAFLRSFPATCGEQSVGSGVLRKSFRESGQTVHVAVDDALRLSVESARPLDEASQARVRDRVSFFLSLDDDLSGFYDRASGDPQMTAVLGALRGYHHVKFATPFENACWAILTQRCAIPAARALKRRLLAAYGDGAFPEAADLLPVSAAELGKTIGHAQKGARLRGVVEAFVAQDERWLRHGPTEAVRAWLLGIPGIGPWSAAFVLWRGLGHADAIDGAEAQLKPKLERLYGHLDSRRWSALQDRYAGVRGYWALYVRTACG
jgi:DNA-3-methyladenine glycosylase II